MKKSKTIIFVLISVLFLTVRLKTVEGNERYSEKVKGAVYDKKLKKTWTKKGSYFELDLWVNYKQAKQYMADKNKEKFAGFTDWRLPSRKELKSLFIKNRKKWYMTYDKTAKLYIDNLFDVAFCYFWTDDNIDDLIWQISLCNGKAYQTKKGNALGNSVILIRP